MIVQGALPDNVKVNVVQSWQIIESQHTLTSDGGGEIHTESMQVIELVSSTMVTDIR